MSDNPYEAPHSAPGIDDDRARLQLTSAWLQVDWEQLSDRWASRGIRLALITLLADFVGSSVLVAVAPEAQFPLWVLAVILFITFLGTMLLATVVIVGGILSLNYRAATMGLVTLALAGVLAYWTYYGRFVGVRFHDSIPAGSRQPHP